MNGRSPASSGPWRRSILVTAFRTKRSRTGLVPGAASASERLLNDRRHEHRLVAGGDRRSDFAESLHRRGEPRRGATGCPSRPPRHRTLATGQPAYGAARPRARHPRTRHSADAVYRALPRARRGHTEFARLSRRAALAGQLLAFPSSLFLRRPGLTSHNREDTHDIWPETCMLWRGSRLRWMLPAHPLSWDGNADSQRQARYDLSLSSAGRIRRASDDAASTRRRRSEGD